MSRLRIKIGHVGLAFVLPLVAHEERNPHVKSPSKRTKTEGAEPRLDGAIAPTERSS